MTTQNEKDRQAREAKAQDSRQREQAARSQRDPHLDPPRTETAEEREARIREQGGGTEPSQDDLDEAQRVQDALDRERDPNKAPIAKETEERDARERDAESRRRAGAQGNPARPGAEPNRVPKPLTSTEAQAKEIARRIASGESR